MLATSGSSKTAQLIQVANLRKPLDTVKSEICPLTCAKVQFRVQRLVVELESRYVTLSMNRDLKFSNGLVATRKFQFLVHT
jgi:hypothetical protein